MDPFEKYERQKDVVLLKFREGIQARYKDRYKELSRTFGKSLKRNVILFLERCLLNFYKYPTKFKLIQIDRVQSVGVRGALGHDMRPYIQLAVELDYLKQVGTEYELTKLAEKFVEAYNTKIAELDMEAANKIIEFHTKTAIKRSEALEVSRSKVSQTGPKRSAPRSKKRVLPAEILVFVKKFIDEESIISRYRIFNHLVLHYKADKHDFGKWDGSVSTAVCKLVDKQRHVRTMVGSHAFISKPDFKIPQNPGLDWWNLDLYYMLYVLVSTFGRGSKVHTKNFIDCHLKYLKNIISIWNFSKPSGKFTDDEFLKHFSNYEAFTDLEKKHFVFTKGRKNRLHNRIVRYFRENYNP